MYKPSTVNVVPPLIPIISNKPFQLVEIDIVGPFNVTENGRKYIMTCIDTYTKWPEAYAIPNQETETIIGCLEDFISRHGVPEAILTDQGRNFEAQLFKSFCQSFGITKKRTTSYHPSCNGNIEQFNGTLVKILARYVSSHQKDWDTWISTAYRTTVHATTKATPFSLL
jgi:transposase InsO family protein